MRPAGRVDSRGVLPPYVPTLRVLTPFGMCVGVHLPEGGRPDDVAGVTERLWPEERALLADLPAARARTFAGGRLALRAALAEAGLSCNAPILRGAAGEPLLPPHLWGSVSHKDQVAVALVAPAVTGCLGGLGVDVEVLTPGHVDISRRILRPEERAALAGCEAEERQRQARLAFSVKEALYKAGFPLVRRFFGFHEAALDLPITFAPERFVSVGARLFPGGQDLEAQVEAAAVPWSTWVVSVARVFGNAGKSSSYKDL